MSFEGYYQFICKEGHLTDHDVNMMEPEDFVCDHALGTPSACTAKLAWWNMVDITNGSHEWGKDGLEKRIDGYIELIPIASTCCDKCHTVLEQKYVMPKKGGHRVTHET